MNSAIRWSPPTRLRLANTRIFPGFKPPGGVGLDEMPLLMENVMDAKQQQQLACVGRKSSSTPMQAQLPPPQIVLFRNSLVHPVILVLAIVAPQGNNANAPTTRALQEEPELVQVQPGCGGSGRRGVKSRSSFPQTRLITFYITIHTLPQ